MFQVTAAGRLGKDAALRTTQGGEKVLGFSIGVDVGYGQNKKTEWIECAIWGTRAEKLVQYLTKGMPVAVTGAGGIRNWESNGKPGTSITCRVSELTMQGGKRDGGRSGDDDGGSARGGHKAAQPARAASSDAFDASIPF